LSSGSVASINPILASLFCFGLVIVEPDSDRTNSNPFKYSNKLPIILFWAQSKNQITNHNHNQKITKLNASLEAKGGGQGSPGRFRIGGIGEDPTNRFSNFGFGGI